MSRKIEVFVILFLLAFSCVMSDEQVTPITQFPLTEVTQTCGFGWSCRSDNHLGVDLNGEPGDQVLSPVDGIVKEATHHGGGYAGTVVIEFQVLTPTGIETNTAVGGHMNYDGLAYPGLQVKVGERVKVGTVLGYLADQTQIDRWNSAPGQFGPHLHWASVRGRLYSLIISVQVIISTRIPML